MASWFSSVTGRHVDILPRVNNPEDVNTTDYLVGGIPFDLKAFSGSGSYVIDNNSRKAKKQAPNIIFDITKTPLSVEEIMGQISSVYRSGRRGLKTVIVKKDSELLYVLEPTRKEK